MSKTVPQTIFKTRVRNGDSFDWKDLSSDEIFKGKKVVLFSLPGAFTPTCSSTHLPGYESNYETLRKCHHTMDDGRFSMGDACFFLQTKKRVTHPKIILFGVTSILKSYEVSFITYESFLLFCNR